MYKLVSELLPEVRRRVRDETTSPRWTDAEITDAIRSSIAQFYGRVGFYVDAPVEGDVFDPPFYMNKQVLYLVDGAIVRTQIERGDAVTSGAIMSGWVTGQEVPTNWDNITLVTPMSEVDTAMVVTGSNMPAYGHVAVMNGEIIRYNGTSANGSNTTLNNLQRDMMGTGRVSESSGAIVMPAVYLDQPLVYEILMQASSEYLHQLYITDASPTEVKDHQWSMRWSSQRTQQMWRGYVPNQIYIARPMRRR